MRLVVNIGIIVLLFFSCQKIPNQSSILQDTAVIIEIPKVIVMNRPMNYYDDSLLNIYYDSLILCKYDSSIPSFMQNPCWGNTLINRHSHSVKFYRQDIIYRIAEDTFYLKSLLNGIHRKKLAQKCDTLPSYMEIINQVLKETRAYGIEQACRTEIKAMRKNRILQKLYIEKASIDTITKIIYAP